MADTIRDAILAAVDREGLTANALAVAVAPLVSRSQVYDYLAGRHDLTTAKADALLDALNLRVRPTRER